MSPGSNVGDDASDVGPKSWRDRLSDFALRPPDPTKAPASKAQETRSLEELEQAERFADDKERAIGLLAAPMGALISLLVVRDLTKNDPPAILHGVANQNHYSLSFINDLQIEVVVLAVIILAASWFRKRLWIGIATALLGISLFNLHYWGFGVPFVLVGSWYLIRAYRAHRAVKEASADPSGSARTGSGAAPRPSKRYTPPTARRKRPAAGSGES